MTEPRCCPQCGAEIPVDAPAGLCPKCLLQAGFESQPSVAATEQSPAASGFVPPSLAEMAQKFPQLEILELLGKGGMGAVYKARQPGLDRLVAVKILPPEVGQDPAFAERFTREARALARLSHPNIVAVYDFGNAAGLYYFIIEFVDGVNLREAIRSGSVNPKETLAIIPQICDALQFAHDEGIVHRDIKPENVLIDKRGRVKIADFGLAKLMGQETIERNLTGTHQVMGTLRYMAPEQMEGSHTVDHRADIYSLGVVFYELLTGEVPLGRFAPPSKKVQIDVRLDEIVLRALEREPQQRYQHASELKTSVDQVTATPGDSADHTRRGQNSFSPYLAAAPSARQPSEMVRRLTLIYLVLVALFAVSLVALQSGYMVGAGNDPAQASQMEWFTGFTWGFGIISLACLGMWGYFVTERPLSPRPRVWKYLAIAWGAVALPLATWFVVWGLSSPATRHEGEAPRIISRTVIGLMAPYVALALVWLIFGPTPEPNASAVPRPPRPPTYTRWVIVPMLTFVAFWVAGSLAAMACYRNQPNGPQQIMAWQTLGLIILVVELFAMLLLRWMQTLPSPIFWTLVKRLVLSAISVVLAVAALLVYMMSPWNTRYFESHGLVFTPQSKAYLRLELPCQFNSQSRSQPPYYSPDKFKLNIEAFYGDKAGPALHLMFVEWPGFHLIWRPEDGSSPHDEPLDPQSPTGYVDHHDHFVKWWQTDAHLDLAKAEVKQEVEELYQLLAGWDSEPPRQWEDFLSHARKTLTHYDFVNELPPQNVIALKETGFVLLYVLAAIVVGFLAAIAASILAARRQQKRSAQRSLPEPQAPSP